MYIKVIDYVGKAPLPEDGYKFRNEIIYPNLIKCIKNNEKLYLDFDGAYGFPTTFIKAIFEDLTPRLFKYILVTTQECDYLKDEIKSYVKKGKR